MLIIVLSLVVVGCTKEKTDADKFEEEYESVNNVVNEHTNKKNRELSIPKDNKPVKTLGYGAQRPTPSRKAEGEDSGIKEKRLL